MSVVRIKICGITRASDALEAARAGANALGFMFYQPSSRHVTIERAADIIDILPPFIARVGVFVNPEPDLVEAVIEQTGIDTLQFHGEETPEFCARFELPVIKAFRLKDGGSLNELEGYRQGCAAWLLDSYIPGRHGGTGRRFNWDLAVEASRWNKPIILAGGLNPANVAAAVTKVRPFGLDVSSGVESSPGKKDEQAMAEFIRNARTADANQGPAVH